MRGVWRSLKTDRHCERSSASPDDFVCVEPGTSRLRLLVVEVAGAQSTVWGWEEAPGGADADTPRLLAACEEMLGRAEAEAQRRTGRRFAAEHMLVGLPASQLLGRAWVVTQRRAQEEQPVEEQELRALLGRALRLAINQLRSAAPPSDTVLRSEYEAPESDDSGWLLVDATTVALTVDGRRVTDPVGFRGREIGATVFAALARAETIEIWRLVARELGFSTLTLTAAPLALVVSLAASQGVLLDVGGATTDVTLWQAGRPTALSSLPAGGAALTHSLMQAWDLPLDQAEYLKLAYASSRLSGDDRAQVQEVLFPALHAWLEGAEVALSRLNEGKPLPQCLYLLGGGSALPDAFEAVRALAWSERLQFGRYPQVERLRPTDVTGVVNRTDLGRGMADVSALALAAWAAWQNRTLDRPARILSELCQGQCSG